MILKNPNVLHWFFGLLLAAGLSMGQASESTHSGDEPLDVGALIMEHILDHPLVVLEPIEVAGIVVDMSITMHVLFMWISALLCIVIFSIVAVKVKAGKGGRFVGLFEVLIQFVRHEVVIANMGNKYGKAWAPYFLTVFFFILFCNLIGLLPGAATATSNVSITAGLAIMAFVVIQAVSIKSAGLGTWAKHLTGGVHWALWPIMIPVEVLGLFTKPFALCIRLFANMTAGHIIILSLLGLIFVFGEGGSYAGYGIAPVSIAFSLFVYLLEILVAFIQAYIFTMLTSVFAGMGIHEEHH